MSVMALRFREDGTVIGDRLVRELTFAPATTVRLAVVCDVANAARERISQLYDCSVGVELFEPVAVPTKSRAALFDGALVFRAHGTSTDCYVIVRASDARRLVIAAYGEAETGLDRELSETEERLIERIAREIAAFCVALCGPIVSFTRANGRMEQYECASYFEMRFSSPLDATIGIALSSDPDTKAVEQLAGTALRDVPIPVRVRVGTARMPFGDVTSLRVGSIVQLSAALADTATLLAGETPVARGEIGEQEGHYAFKVAAREARLPA